VGPPGVGKTTLVKSLIRRYTKQTLNDIRGPVTVVSGKKRRLTLIECNNDLGSLIDIGKVADLVLLMIDGSFGFEMVSLSTTLPYIGSVLFFIGNVRVSERPPSPWLPKSHRRSYPSGPYQKDRYSTRHQKGVKKTLLG
jgi:hypothetical protein